MASLKQIPKLSIIIPTINEASRLPLLLADINEWPYSLDLCIADCGSNDKTLLTAKLSGARIVRTKKPSRGLQLKKGAIEAKGEWLLFLHADSRLVTGWSLEVENAINCFQDKDITWYFNLKVKRNGFAMRLMELFVLIRSNIFKQPYGDQGLLIKKTLYEKVGGYKSIPLMEDIELIDRVSKESNLRSLGINIETDGKKWNNTNIAFRGIKSFALRYRWRKGESPEKLYKDYYQVGK